MRDIYDQHKAAFANVSAYVIIDENGERVATVAIRYPKNGLKLWAYVHLIGVQMVRGSAGGGGYDKASAAVAQAISKIPFVETTSAGAAMNANRLKLIAASEYADGLNWTRALERQGFRVLQAV